MVRTRTIAVLVTGALAGIGGAYLANVGAGIFVPFITNGAGFRDRLGALLIRRQVLGAAVIGLQSAKLQVRCIGDTARERGGRHAGCNPAALHADIDLDQHVQGGAGRHRRGRQRVHLGGVVDADADPGLASQAYIACSNFATEWKVPRRIILSVMRPNQRST